MNMQMLFADRTHPMGIERLRRDMEEIDYAVPSSERILVNENSNEVRSSIEQDMVLVNAMEPNRRQQAVHMFEQHTVSGVYIPLQIHTTSLSITKATG